MEPPHVLALSGELDLSNVAELRRRIDDAFAGSSGFVILDLSDVRHMDSTGLAELISAHQRAADLRGGLALVVTSRSIRRTLEIRGVARLFNIASSVEEAHEALSGSPDLS
jgi:anti-sigma B factor antagonist